VGDFRPFIDVALDAFGVSAVVTRPGLNQTPITTTGFWISPLEETRPYGTDVQRGNPRRVFVLSRAAVPVMPDRGTRIVAPLQQGAAAETWKVDGFERAVDVDHWRLILIPWT
jgi:hypothetical protein